jgi:hypothetical protein
MRQQLAEATAEAGLTNIEVHEGRWPVDGWSQEVDVSMAAHAIYDIAAIEPFIEAMERHTRRLCVVLLRPWARGGYLAELFEAVHGEPMQVLPALREFVSQLGALGRVEVRTSAGDESHGLTPRDAAFAEARRLLWLAEGSEKEQRMRALMEEWWGTLEGIRMPAAPPYVGVVSWTPPGR